MNRRPAVARRVKHPWRVGRDAWKAVDATGIGWWIDSPPHGLADGQPLTIEGEPEDQFCRLVAVHDERPTYTFCTPCDWGDE